MGEQWTHDMLRKLKRMDQDIAGKAVKKSLRAGAKVIQTALVAAAPVKSGQTRAAIVVKAMKKKAGRIGMLVQLGRKSFQGDAWYAEAVDRGHKVGRRPSKARIKAGEDSRGFIPGTHWLEKTFAAAAAAARSEIERVLAIALSKLSK
jgi:HK97 gp10 family phage protein